MVGESGMEQVANECCCIERKPYDGGSQAESSGRKAQLKTGHISSCSCGCVLSSAYLRETD